MAISRLIFLLLLSDVSLAQIISNNSLVTSLIRHLNVHHVYLLKPDEEGGNEEFLKLQKSIWDWMPWLYISVISTSNLASIVESGSGPSTKCSVILFESKFADGLESIPATLKSDASQFKWILIENSYEEEEYRDFEIPYNSEFLIAIGSDDAGYEIHELYDTLNVKKIRNFLGKWSSAEGLKMTNLEVAQRRGNLRGTIFNISSNQHNPCSVQSFESSAGSVLMCIHYHLFNLFSQKYNFSINWLAQNAGAFGSTYTPSYLSDTIQFTIFEVNSNPAEGTTVIWPTTATPIAVYTSYTGRSLGWSTYIYPFSKQMWLAVLVWFLLSAAIISVAEYLTYTLNVSNGSGRRLWLTMWLKYVFLAYSAFCYQNEGVDPEKMSLRILLFLIFLIPTALVPGYSAALTSYLAVTNEMAPFTTLEGLSRAKDYKLGHVASFNLSVFLDRNSKDEVIQTLYRDILIPADQMPVKEADGVQRMCKEKFSYVCTVFTVLAVPPKCSFYSLDRPIVVALSMLPVKSNNPFKNLISRSMRDFIYSGVFLIEAVRVLPVTVTNPVVEEEEPQTEAIELGNVIAIIALLGFGVFISILILLLEWISFRRRHSNLTNILPR